MQGFIFYLYVFLISFLYFLFFLFLNKKWKVRFVWSYVPLGLLLVGNLVMLVVAQKDTTGWQSLGWIVTLMLLVVATAFHSVLIALNNYMRLKK